jgi:hypothetical protein
MNDLLAEFQLDAKASTFDPSVSYEDKCYLAFVDNTGDFEDSWVLGTSFLNGFYTTFDSSEATGPRMGFA